MRSLRGDLSFEDDAFVVKPGREAFPCGEVTWYGALAYCNFRSEVEGLEPNRGRYHIGFRCVRRR